MAIVQISKIQQRSGNLVDLPQLDEAELGFASDAKRLFVGKTVSGLENIEVLTSYSAISFSQVNGAYGNLDITGPVGDGQVLSYDLSSNTWINKGGTAGGHIDLGEVSNLTISGGSIGYVLETDGLGNLTWTSKGTTIAYIENITQASPAVLTTTEENFIVEGAEVTITNCPGMTEVNGQQYWANVLTSNTFALYTDQTLTTPLDSSAFTEYSFSSVTETTAATNRITVGDSSVFALNIPVKFTGDVSGTELDNTTTYYIKAIPSGTSITVSKEIYANGVAGNVWPVNNVSGLTANVYGSSGRVISPLGGFGAGNGAAGANTSVQYNYNNVLTGDGDFTWEFGTSPKVLGVTGNANITGNINTTDVVIASRLFSNVATGTSPLQVDSTTRVANLNVAYSNVSDNSVVGNLTTGNYFPALVSTSATGNKPLNVSGSYTFDTANARFVAGNVVANYDVQGSTLTGGITTNAQPNITSVGTLSSLEVAGDITPDANVTYNLGNNTNRFNDLYLSGSSIYLGATTITSNLTSTNFSANISANIISGNIQSTADMSNFANITVTSNIYTGNINANYKGTFSNLLSGNATVTSNLTSGNANVTGNINAGNITTGGLVSAQFFTGVLKDGTSNVTVNTDGNIDLTSAGNTTLIVTATGVEVAGTANVSGNLDVPTINTNTINTTDLVSTNVNATSGTFTTVTGTLTTNAQPNVTSVGTLTSLDVTGNITGGNLVTTGEGDLGSLTVSGETNLGDVSNVHIDGGTANYILKTDGTGNLSWTNPDGGYYLHTQTVANTVWNINHGLNRRYVGVEAIDGSGISYTGRYDYPTIEYVDANNLTMTWSTALSGYAAITGGGTNINSVLVAPATTPAGVDTQVQFNDAGALAGNNGLVFDKTTGTLTATVLESSGLNISGNIIPTSNIAYDIGNNTNRFNDLYLSGSTIYLGDETITSNGLTGSIDFSGNIHTSQNIGTDEELRAGTVFAVDTVITPHANISGNIEATTSSMFITGEQGGANGYVHHDFANNIHSFVGINSGLGPVNATVETEYFDALRDTDGVVPGMPTKMRLYMEGMQSYAGSNPDAYFTLNQSSTSTEFPGPVWTAGHPSSTNTHIFATGNIGADNAHLSDGVFAGSANINGVANISNLEVTGTSTFNADMTVNGNITADQFIANGAGTPTLSSATNLDLSATTAVRVVGGGVFSLPQLTSNQISNIAFVADGSQVFDTTTGYIKDYFAGEWYDRNAFREGISLNGNIEIGSSNVISITGETGVGVNTPGSLKIDLSNLAETTMTLYGSVQGGTFGDTKYVATGGQFRATYNTSYFPASGTPLHMEMSTTGLHGDSGTSSISDSFFLSNDTISNAVPGHVWTAGQIGGNSDVHIQATGNMKASYGLFNEVFTTEIHAGVDQASSDENTNGAIKGNWILSGGSRLQATYADLAEYYEGDQVYEAGTVLMFGGEKEVTLAENETFRIAGVVSTNPAYLMNAECPGNKVAVALQGRCPVKVKGPTRKGDLMISAGDGFAKASEIQPQVGTVLGKALENFDGEEGVIEIAIGRL